MDQEGIAEMMLDENAIAQVARKNDFLLSTLMQQELFWSGLSSIIKQYTLEWSVTAFSYCYKKSFQLFSDCIDHMILIYCLGLSSRDLDEKCFVSFSSTSLYQLSLFHQCIDFWLLLQWETKEKYALGVLSIPSLCLYCRQQSGQI